MLRRRCGARLPPGLARAVAPARIEEYPRLSYTWVAGEIDTVVTFSIAPTASGTHLSIVQAGFKQDQKQNFGGARYGWKLMGGRLVELLETLA